MPSLSRIHDRFEIPLTVIEGGKGVIYGLLTEADQTQVPAYTFVQPRHILRTSNPTALKHGMVVRSPGGTTFVVGQNGDGELPQGTTWKSFRLYEATAQVSWQRRIKTIDPITELERDSGAVDMGLIWVALEPMDREAPDRKIRMSFEQDRIICGALIEHDDIVNGKKVTRADRILGLTIGTLA